MTPAIPSSRGLDAEASRLSHRLKRALQIWRDEGPRSLWFKILGRTVYRRAVLVELVLRETGAPAPSALAVTFDRLGEADVEAYVRFRPETAPATVRDRLGAGYLCVVARHEGRIVNAVWIARGRAWIDYLACDVELASDEAYVYESFTSPEFRGQGIPAVGVAHVARHVREAGCRRLVAVILPENRAALRHAVKAGWRAVGRVGYVKLGRWRRDFRRLEGNAGQAP